MPLSIFGIVICSYAQATESKQEHVVILGTEKKELNLVKDYVA